MSPLVGGGHISSRIAGPSHVVQQSRAQKAHAGSAWPPISLSGPAITPSRQILSVPSCWGLLGVSSQWTPTARSGSDPNGICRRSEDILLGPCGDDHLDRACQVRSPPLFPPVCTNILDEAYRSAVNPHGGVASVLVIIRAGGCGWELLVTDNVIHLHIRPSLFFVRDGRNHHHPRWIISPGDRWEGGNKTWGICTSCLHAWVLNSPQIRNGLNPPLPPASFKARFVEAIFVKAKRAVHVQLAGC